MKVVELKEELGERGEALSGNKAWLRRRLHAAIVSEYLESAAGAAGEVESIVRTPCARSTPRHSESGEIRDARARETYKMRRIVLAKQETTHDRVQEHDQAKQRHCGARERVYQQETLRGHGSTTH